MKEIHVESLNKELLKELRIDCARCSGLCCVALYFAKCDGFPRDKVAGEPCKNLGEDFKCTIHADLITQNMKGCLAYECFGAGPKVTNAIYKGSNWKDSKQIVNSQFDVFVVVWKLHQMLWYLLESTTIVSEEGKQLHIESTIEELRKLTKRPPEEILQIKIETYRERVNEILKDTGRFVSNRVNKREDSKKGKEFMGKNFKKANLDGKDFSMSLLIAANLEGCSLRGTNFLGADLRDANLKNTDLRESIFLTQTQINSAKGNKTTKLPEMLVLPATW